MPVTLPPMPGVFPDYPAPVVRNAGAERELTMMRLGISQIVPGVEGAYQRGELLAKRRKLMDDWSNFCLASQPSRMSAGS